MRSRIIAAAVAASLVVTTWPVYAKDKTPEMTPLQIQSMQTHEFEGTKEEVFASVMSVLQDSGYRIENADLPTGLITGVGSSKGKVTYNLLFGFGKSKKSPIVSAYIEKFGSMVRVRLNFVMAKVKSTAYGSQPQDEEPILDPAVHQDAFEKIGQSLFVRQSMSASPVGATAPASATVPTATQTQGSPAATPPPAKPSGT